jgi:hypothetical protein
MKAIPVIQTDLSGSRGIGVGSFVGRCLIRECYKGTTSRDV